jgi:hypothetical protein
MFYKSNSKRGCWFLSHDNKCTHKLQISTRQVESNVQSLIDLSADIGFNILKYKVQGFDA